MLTGFRPRHKLQNWVGIPISEPLDKAARAEVRRSVWSRARHNQHDYLARHKKRSRDSRPWPRLKVLDVVMVYDHKKHHTALQASWMAPYEVTAVLPHDTYRVKHMWHEDEYVRHRRDLMEFNMTQVTEEDMATLPHRDMSKRIPAYISNESTDKTQVQIHWLGLPTLDRTWEESKDYIDSDLYSDWKQREGVPVP